MTLSALSGLIVIDEIQRKPELFPTLRVLVDQAKPKQQFLILGSASRELLQQSSETLTGRIHYRLSTSNKIDVYCHGRFKMSLSSSTQEKEGLLLMKKCMP